MTSSGTLARVMFLLLAARAAGGCTSPTGADTPDETEPEPGPPVHPLTPTPAADAASAAPDTTSATAVATVRDAGGVDGAARADAAALRADGGQPSPPAAAELVFSAVRGRRASEQKLPPSSGGAAATLEVTGKDASSFLAATGSAGSAGVVFAPPLAGALGVHRARLIVSAAGSTREVDLYGLATRGEQGENEPPLHQVVLALGFAIDVGGTKLALGVKPTLIGDEVSAPRFLRAGAGPVVLRPVARYSPDEGTPFGYFAAPGTLTQVGVLARGHEQTLNPAVLPGTMSSFEPPSDPFGLYVKTSRHPVFTEPGLNTGPAKHGTRAYPLKDREGRPLPNAFLVGFEEKTNGDYQDFVFVISNVTAVP